jgi:hypothetical protein
MRLPVGDEFANAVAGRTTPKVAPRAPNRASPLFHFIAFLCVDALAEDYWPDAIKGDVVPIWRMAARLT